MDPIAITGSFATIVGLLHTFLQGRKDGEKNTVDDLFNWLEKHNFADIKKDISRNGEYLREIKSILEDDYHNILDKLDKIDGMLAGLLRRVDGFGGMVNVFKPGAGLSDQAISILRQFVESGKNYFIKIEMKLKTSLALQQGHSIEYSDFRFLDDDLKTLLELELLRCEPTSRGDERYIITRDAVDYIKMIDGK